MHSRVPPVLLCRHKPGVASHFWDQAGKHVGVNNRARVSISTLSHLLNKYLLSIDCAPGFVLGEGVYFA